MKPESVSQEPLNLEQAKIAKFLKKLRFRRKFLGVDEADVWKQIETLNTLYDQALRAERLRYDLLLEEMYGRASGTEPAEGREGVVYGEARKF